MQVAFYPLAIITGALLFALVVLLTLFNARKKLPFLPLLKASAWMQFHAYAGWLSVFVFMLHMGWRWPNGALEQALAAVFVVVAGSGVLGMILSRALPTRMTRAGDPVVFERIPGLVMRLREHIDELILKTEEATGSTTLADFHGAHLRRYLQSKPSWFAFLADRDQRHARVRAELGSTRRYLNAEESEAAEELCEAIEAKHNLDYQYSAQRLLKLWLFVHIPLTYSLIIIAAVHACVAISYSTTLW